MNDINENEITVIISTLNVANQIEKTILSYLDQDFKKKNLIIVDGNSSDHTVEIIKKYSNNLQYWVSENDDGIYDAWNKAIRNTNTEWVCFIGAGDVFYSNNTLTKLIMAKTNPKTNFISGKIFLIDKKDIFIESMGKKWDFNKLSKNITIGHPLSLHKLELLKRYNLFDIKYKICGDYDFLIRSGKSIFAEYLNEFVVIMKDDGVSKKHFLKATTESAKALIKSKDFGLIIGTKFFVTSIIKIILKKILFKSNYGRKFIVYLKSILGD